MGLMTSAQIKDSLRAIKDMVVQQGEKIDRMAEEHEEIFEAVKSLPEDAKEKMIEHMAKMRAARKNK